MIPEITLQISIVWLRRLQSEKCYTWKQGKNARQYKKLIHKGSIGAPACICKLWEQKSESNRENKFFHTFIIFLTQNDAILKYQTRRQGVIFPEKETLIPKKILKRNAIRRLGLKKCPRNVFLYVDRTLWRKVEESVLLSIFYSPKRLAMISRCTSSTVCSPLISTKS